jgi:hypothetical protein
MRTTATASLGINREDLDLVSRTVLRLGGYAEGLFDHMHFGFDKETLRSHITNVYSMLKEMRESPIATGISLRPPNLPPGAFFDDQGEMWNYLQALRLAAGATMVSELYRPFIRPENLQKAMTSKILFECQVGILDDLVDKSSYSYLEAKDLYHLVFSSMIDPDFDTTVFMKRLMTMLRQEQVPLFDLINSITRGVNLLWNNSPNGSRYFYQMEVLNDRVALGQALTMFQKEPNFSIGRMERVATSFYAPRDGLAWWEKIGGHIAGVSRYNFVDMAFSDHRFDRRDMDRFMAGWYYLDSTITLMDHVSGIHKDLQGGIANLSLIAMRQPELRELTTVRGYNPHLTIDDYDKHIRRIAHLTADGLRFVEEDLADETLFYPFIAIMIPVVMLADWIGNRDDMIRKYLQAIAPAIREHASNGREAAGPLVDVAVEIARGG